MFVRVFFFSIIVCSIAQSFFRTNFYPLHNQLLITRIIKMNTPSDSVESTVMKVEEQHAECPKPEVESVHLKLYEKQKDSAESEEHSRDKDVANNESKPESENVDLITILEYRDDTNEIVVASNCDKGELDLFKTYYVNESSSATCSNYTFHEVNYSSYF